MNEGLDGNMGGPRANYIYVRDDYIVFDKDKYGGGSVLNWIFAGLKCNQDIFERVKGWNKEFLLSDISASYEFLRTDHLLYDTTYCEGALLINFDRKYAIVGFDEWHSFDTSRVEELFAHNPDYYAISDVSVLRMYCFELLKLFWPADWSFYWADYRDFAVSDNLKTQIEDIMLLPMPSPEDISLYSETRESVLVTLTKGLMVDAPFDIPSEREIKTGLSRLLGYPYLGELKTTRS